LTWTDELVGDRLIEWTMSGEALAGSQRDPLQMQRRLGDLRVGDRRVALLEHLDLELRQLGHLPRHLPEALGHVLPQVVGDGRLRPLTSIRMTRPPLPAEGMCAIPARLAPRPRRPAKLGAKIVRRMAPPIVWTFEPSVLVGVFAFATLIYVRAGTRARPGEPHPPGYGRLALFAGSMLCVLAALISPIDTLATDLLVIHMVQHLLLLDRCRSC
jgi:hypothetical protein